jgi:hypothetical protein
MKNQLARSLRYQSRGITRGVGSLLDLLPASRNAFEINLFTVKSATEALESDWQKLGSDMNRAIEGYREDYVTE